MAVIISECSKMKTYHRSGCLYEMRMKTRNRYSVSEEQARDLGYRPCKCCWTLKGALRALHMTLPGLGHQKNMELTYRDSTDTLFMRTANGFWKTYWKEDAGFFLYHLNDFDPFLPTEQMMDGRYHRQRDVKPTRSIVNVLNYVRDHDKAKEIMETGYRNLPQNTKRQRKYYKQAQWRQRRQEIRRVDALFEMLDRQKAGYPA